MGIARGARGSKPFSQHPLVRRVERFVGVNELLPQSSRLLTAVSGGADSVFLLRALCALARALDITIEVAFFDHGWRGEAAAADGRFVSELARSLGVLFHRGEVDTRALRRATKASPEEAARVARYRYLARVCEQRDLTAVAVGHTQDDAVETYLLAWLRGSGPAGAAALPASGPLPVPRSRARLIRPLLPLTGTEIRATLQQIGQSWREDVTNTDPSYLRNRVRHELVPLLESLAPGFRSTVLRSAELARLAADFLERSAAQAGATVFTRSGHSLAVPRAAFLALDPALRGPVLAWAVGMLAGTRQDLESAHLEGALRVIERGAGGRTVPLGPAAEVALRRGVVVVTPQAAAAPERG